MTQLVAGACTTVALGVLIHSAAALLRITSPPAWWVVFIATLAAGLAGLLWSRDLGGRTLWMTAGGLGAAAAVILAGSVYSPGVGALEVSVLLGAVLTAVGRPVVTRYSWPGRRALLASVAGLSLLLMAPQILGSGPLGHDESAYALKAQSWLDGGPEAGWSPHRGLAMSWVAYPILAAGGGEDALRAFGVLGVLALALATFLLGETIGGTRTGLLASLVVLSGPTVLYRGGEFLSDVPSAALLVFVLIILIRHLDRRDLPGWGLLWVLPLAVAAFYLRHQSALTLFFVGVTAAILWWRKMRSRPGPVAALLAGGVAAFIPHLINSTSLTGSPLGILTFVPRVGAREYIGQGLVDYAGQFPILLAGPLGALFIIATVVGGTALAARGGLSKVHVLMLTPALALILFLGLSLPGEPRFLVYSVVMLVTLGAWIVLGRLPALGYPMRVAVTSGLVVALVGTMAFSLGIAERRADNRARSNQVVVEAAEGAAETADGGDCLVVTSYNPQVGFYSRCSTSNFPSYRPGRFELEMVLLVEAGKRQPVGEELEALVAASTGTPLVFQAEGRGAQLLILEG